MKKNVLIISGSPRKKGNSDILCERFKQGAEEAGKISGRGMNRQWNRAYLEKI